MAPSMQDLGLHIVNTESNQILQASCMYVLRTDYKPEQFVDGLPVYKPAIQFLTGWCTFNYTR